MLRPATPLTILLLAAFGLLLLSVLSTPIISAIPLGTFGDYKFGVFGYCKGSTCSGIEIGYDGSLVPVPPIYVCVCTDMLPQPKDSRDRRLRTLTCLRRHEPRSRPF